MNKSVVEEECQYCNSDYYSETYPIRSSYADDNFCEIATDGLECGNCNKGCMEDKNHFEISYYNDFISVSHWREIENINSGVKIVSAQFTERLNRNYCHNCGRKLKQGGNND